MPAGAAYVGRPTRWGNPATPANLHVITARFHLAQPITLAGHAR